MFNLPGLIGYAHCRVNALDEHDTENGEGGRHDGYNPCPGGEEAEDISEYVLKVRLHSAYDIN